MPGGLAVLGLRRETVPALSTWQPKLGMGMENGSGAKSPGSGQWIAGLLVTT